MKKRGIAILICVMMCSSILGCGSTGKAELLVPKTVQEEAIQKESEGEAKKEVEKSTERSVWEFSKQLLQENMQEENPVLSPVSVYLAMGMTGLGAAGDTLQEFHTVMGGKVHEAAEQLIQKLPRGTMPEGKVSKEETRETVLSLANSAWVDNSLAPLDSWLTAVSEKYNAEVYHGELSDQGTMKQMNGWIKHKTNGMIENFLSKPLEPDTCLALFNTVYFYGQWRSEFSAGATQKDAFTLENGTEQQVDMMRKNRTHLYYVMGEDWDGAVLPYRDGKTVFAALKPTADQSVREMFDSFSEDDLKSVLEVEATTYANLKLPKFEVTFDKELNEALINMGLQSAFDPDTADFSELGISDMGNIYISLVRQKAVIAVDEKGTEAAAVTMVTQKATSAAPPKEEPIDVFFDKPFLYMIVDVEQQMPVFMGIMDCPK